MTEPGPSAPETQQEFNLRVASEFDAWRAMSKAQEAQIEQLKSL
jgi:hypothetical protein